MSQWTPRVSWKTWWSLKGRFFVSLPYQRSLVVRTKHQSPLSSHGSIRSKCVYSLVVFNLKLKMEAGCTPETQETLPTSTRWEDSRATNITIKQQKNAVYRGHVHFNAVDENIFIKVKLKLTLKVLPIFNSMTYFNCHSQDTKPS
jgi:hypothetical protein